MTALHLELKTYPKAAETHHHPHHQMVLSLRGRLEMEIAGHGGAVTWQRGVLIDAGQRHTFSSAGQNQFVVLDIPAPAGELVRPADRDRWGFFTVPPGLLHLMKFVDLRASRIAAVSTEVAELILASLLPGDEARRPLMPARITQAMAFIRESHPRPITCADIAGEINLSVRRLHTLFQEWVGESPIEHLRGVRLARARNLLADLDLTIAEVALAVGFSDQSAFTRSFLRSFGETPGRFRRRLGRSH